MTLIVVTQDANLCPALMEALEVPEDQRLHAAIEIVLDKIAGDRVR